MKAIKSNDDNAIRTVMMGNKIDSRISKPAPSATRPSLHQFLTTTLRVSWNPLLTQLRLSHELPLLLAHTKQICLSANIADLP